MVAYTITITGVVQGVGFRPFVYNLAERLGVRGWVLNHSGGVSIAAEGDSATLQRFIAALEAEAPPLAHIATLEATPTEPQGYEAFEIRHSQRQAGQYQLISPDVATCDDCRRELFDPADRRYRYPFINCTNCGPRFTIIADIPYDRPNTTMRIFPLCDDCRTEYEDPTDRRFHAQPNACPVCGPHVWLVDGESGETVASRDEALMQARDLLLAGKILALKGLGGFHLACDATNAAAVQALRERKRRPHKPFALMVPTLEDARALCEVPPEAATLLTSPQSPIVLLPERESPAFTIADAVAPHSQTLGLMLPYTPLHHLLLHDVARPLVMTSGNLTEEPIAKDNEEALRRLAPLADAFLLHDRDIYARYDDSVWHAVTVAETCQCDSRLRLAPDGVFEEQPQLPEAAPQTAATSALPDTDRSVTILQPLRRARGYAPFPVTLPFKVEQIFAAGPELKATFTLARDRFAFMSQHIGDIENLETLEHYEAALETYLHLFRVTPERVACDLHPDYLSTRFAQQYAEAHGLPAPLRVQHHKAHIWACLAENGVPADDQRPVIGVALDGTGYGEDGNIWGGEWFVGDYRGLRRAAHLEYLPLPGGDAAIRNPWRITLSYLYTLLGPESFPAGLFCPAEAGMVRQQVARRLNTPLTSSMGRLFDAVSALLDVRHTITYEAQAAIELEQLAASPGPDAVAPYPFALEEENGVHVVRLAALFDALLDERARDVPRSEIALRFHVTVAHMVLRVCQHLGAEARLGAESGSATVVLSGGVFQNRLLLKLVLPLLRAHGFDLLLHRQVPCNDATVSLGQAVRAHFAAGGS